jgi:ribosomal protein S18 acetylase RimI-like enzyme
VCAKRAIVESYRPEHFDDVRRLWEEAFPDDPPHNRAEVAIPAKLALQPELLLVALDDGAVVGTAMAGYDGHRGWLYSVAVRRSHRRAGVGSLLVREAERRLAKLGCGKVNLQVRAQNAAIAAFYRTLGYEIEDRVSMGKRLGG